MALKYNGYNLSLESDDTNGIDRATLQYTISDDVNTKLSYCISEQLAQQQIDDLINTGDDIGQIGANIEAYIKNKEGV